MAFCRNRWLKSAAMMDDPKSWESEDKLLLSLLSNDRVSGLTHSFYRYPARMSPDFAKAAISRFSSPGEIVLDPFAGGGTTTVEAIAAGRRAVAIDINPLATFVVQAKTTPLSTKDLDAVRTCFSDLQEFDTWGQPRRVERDSRLLNFPVSLEPLIESCLAQIELLQFPRQRRFARCVLLRASQKAIDGRRIPGNPEQLVLELEKGCSEMAAGLSALVQLARENGVKKHNITGFRKILLRSAIGLEHDRRMQPCGAPKLVVTSPPYPGVHVLYHRWQVGGRKETPGPYWIIGQPDGYGASHFTMGSRSEFGVDNYFLRLTEVFQSVRSTIENSGVVVQLVSFSDIDSQLPRFLRAMEEAGFREDLFTVRNRALLWRSVPNRRWYFRVNANRKSASELLLIHLPS